jgi:hypothetical protein
MMASPVNIISDPIASDMNTCAPQLNQSINSERQRLLHRCAPTSNTWHALLQSKLNYRWKSIVARENMTNLTQLAGPHLGGPAWMLVHDWPWRWLAKLGQFFNLKPSS